MKEELNPPEEFDAEYQANVTLSYEYLEKSIKEIQDITNNANTQSGLLVGFNFTFIRFFLNGLPSDLSAVSTPLECLRFILLFAAYFASGISIVCCFSALSVSTEFLIVPPERLLQECNLTSNTALKLGIIQAWQQKLKQFIRLQKKKKRLLNTAIRFLIVSAIIAVIDYALGYL